MTVATDTVTLPGTPTSFALINDTGTNTSDGITNDARFAWAAVAGATSYEVSVNGTSWTDIGNVTNYNFTGLSIPQGANTAYVRAKNAGGAGTATNQAFTFDTLAPSTPSTLTLSGNAGATAGYTNTQSIALNVADVTDVSGVSWYVSESSSAPAAAAAGWSSTKPTSFTLSTGNGTKNVYVYAKDGLGNIQTTGKSANIILDGSVPTISTLPVWGAAIPSGAVVNKSITFADTSGGSPKSVSISSGGVGSVSNVVV